MSGLTSLLLELLTQKVGLWLEGDRLCYRAPVGALADTLLREMQLHKPELVALLRSASDSSDRPGAHPMGKGPMQESSPEAIPERQDVDPDERPDYACYYGHQDLWQRPKAWGGGWLCRRCCPPPPGVGKILQVEQEESKRQDK
jgi:hypothetical protein